MSQAIAATAAGRRHILTLAGPDRPGIVAGVAGYLYQQDCNIAESAQFEDRAAKRFFMRTVFETGAGSPAADALAAGFAAVGKRFQLDWQMHDASARPRLLILVSRFDHCLVELLYRARTGQLPVEIAGIVSNHADSAAFDRNGIPFTHLSITPDSKHAQEAKLAALIERERIELVVLARYMQVLSDDFCRRLAGRCINIHHSFLPGFKGAKPYHQAFERGVKLIGATAHYVTTDLDEGPIIEQAVERVDHSFSPEDLIATGRDIEKLVLSRAVQLHVERRVLLNGAKTVVFRK